MEQALLFGDSSIQSRWRAAFDAWLAMRAASTSTRRKDGPLSAESAAIYRDMWKAFATFCGERAIGMDELEPDDLELYLTQRAAAPPPALPLRRARKADRLTSRKPQPSRVKGTELTERYAWRLLWLIDQVVRHAAAESGTAANEAALTLLQTERFRFALAANKDPLPEYLQEAHARALIAFITEIRSADSPAGPFSWKELRDRTAVALMLGAGLTPGDVRALTLSGVIAEGGRRAGIPWKLALPGNGQSPARETPLASWAGRQLAVWLAVRAEHGIPGEYVFASTAAGKPWSHPACHASCKAVLEEAGFSPDAAGGLFKLRHTFALRQLAKGKTDAEVARWLGLQDLTAVARYRRIVPWQVDVA